MNINQAECWDKNCSNLNLDYRQYYFWGEFKQRFNWIVERIETDYSKKNIFQILIKKKWPIVLCYIPGLKIIDNNDLDFIKKTIKNKYKYYLFKYIRIDTTNLINENINIQKHNFFKTLFKKNGNSLITQILEGSFEDKISKCRLNWKKSIKKALKNNINIEHVANPNSKLVYNLTRNLEQVKKLGKAHSHEEVLYLIENLKKNLFYIQAKDNKNNVIGFRAAIITKNTAWDFFSITNKIGRNLNAGHLLTIDIFQKLQDRGIKYYKYLGEDKVKMPNIFLFKIGTNNKNEDYIGEIEWSNFKFIKKIINFYLKLFYSDETIRFIRKKH